KIVAAGQSRIATGNGFALLRYNTDGTLDPTFGNRGKVSTDFGVTDQGFSSAGASAVVVRPDGTIVAVGRAYLNGDFHSALAQYTTSGALDAGFGTGGRLTNIFGGDSDGVSSVAVQPDGKIVVAGGVSVDWVGDFALARFN